MHRQMKTTQKLEIIRCVQQSIQLFFDFRFIELILYLNLKKNGIQYLLAMGSSNNRTLKNY